ncbi:aminopeptidase Q isoform X2 [Solenopsis invicta]|uniref:aminopeptidase Q isoform X2 n=1 Tax=Solenopsis invicta TaxID=13686 RepID=UPI00193D4D1B|nr:aminopeptidase Q isoform X2 [Solenopsis invicta]
MAIVKSLLAAVLLLLTSQGVFLQDNETVNDQIVQDVNENRFCLRQNVVPIHYDIKLTPHIVENNFTTNGETNIDVEVRESTNDIELHVLDLTIDESLTKLIRKGVDVNSKSEYVPKQHIYNFETQILTLQFEELLDPAMYTLHFTFTGMIRAGDYWNRGLYRRFYINDKGHKTWLAVTHLQPTSARKVFPCWDEPAIKSTFKLSIKHCPNYTALSNMPSVGSEIDESDGKLWTYFETTPVMSTNLVAFVIADYDYVSNLDGNIKIWGPKHLLSYAGHTLDIAEKIMQELEKFTNSTVRVPKMDHVAIPRYTTRATENWGMIVYQQDLLLGDNSLSSNIQNVMTITHELAHQWFGNLVSSVWWKYFWLSEGISTYLKYYISDKFFKEKRLMDYTVVTLEQEMLDRDSWRSEPIHVNITGHSDVVLSKAYSPRTYKKSAFLLRMASQFLTEDVFRNGLIKYLQAHEYSSATPNDLWKTLQDALDESNVPHDDFKVKEVMNTWFDQAWYPLVTVHRDYTTGEIRLTQEIFTHPENNSNYKGNKEETWWIPINFATQSSLDFSSTLATHWLKPHDEDTIIEGVNTNDWIIVNKNLTGFYRVNYDTINWQRIAAFLNTDNYHKIPVLNRAQIIDDAYYMMETERLDSTTFVEIMNYLSHETDPAPWFSAIKNIFECGNCWQLPEGEAILKPYLSNLMHKLFEHIGFEKNPEDDVLTTEIRTYLFERVCMYGFADCQAIITSKLLAYMEDPIANNPPYHHKQVLCIGLRKANESFWDQLLQTQQRTSNFHKQFLGCSKNLHILERHLNYLSNDTEEHRDFTRNMFQYFQNTDVVLELVTTNYEKFYVFVKIRKQI